MANATQGDPKAAGHAALDVLDVELRAEGVMTLYFGLTLPMLPVAGPSGTVTVCVHEQPGGGELHTPSGPGELCELLGRLDQIKLVAGIVRRRIGAVVEAAA
jgi:hypothetical protein